MDDMENMMGVFRTSTFGGFNKTDVLNYMNDQKRIEATLRSSLNALDQQLRTLSEQLKKVKEQRDAAREELAKDSGSAQETKSALAIRETEYAVLEKRCEHAERKNQELKDEIEHLHQRIAELEGEKAPVSVSEKSTETDIGTVMVDARRFADQMINEAKQNAAKITEKTRDFAEGSMRKTDIILAELQLCSEKMDKFFKEINHDMDLLRKDLKTAMTDSDA